MVFGFRCPIKSGMTGKGPDMSSNVSSQENGRKYNLFFQKHERAVFFPFINCRVVCHKEITYICRGFSRTIKNTEI